MTYQVRSARPVVSAAGLCSWALTAGLVTVMTVAAWVPAARAAGAWGAPVTLSAPGALGEAPVVAMDPAGGATAVWTVVGSRDSGVQAATRPAGGSFSAPVALSGRDGSGGPDIAFDAAGNAIAVWCRFNGLGAGTVEVATRPLGGTFSAPIAVATLEGCVAPYMAIDAAGDAIIVWAEEANFSIHASVRAAGGTFSKPITLSPTGQADVFPGVAIGPAGRAIVVWSNFINGDLRTTSRAQAVTVTDAGVVSKPVNLSPRDGALPAEVAIASSGSAIVAWTANTRRKRTGVQVVTLTAGGLASAPMNLSDPGHDATFSGLAMNPAGATVLVWLRRVGTRFEVQTSTGPTGGRFAKPVDLSALRENADAPSVAVNRAGEAVVIWRSGTDGFIRAAVRAPGRRFSKPVKISGALPGGTYINDDVAISPSGSAIAVWERQTGRYDSIIQAAALNAPVSG